MKQTETNNGARKLPTPNDAKNALRQEANRLRENALAKVKAVQVLRENYLKARDEAAEVCDMCEECLTNEQLKREIAEAGGGLRNEHYRLESVENILSKPLPNPYQKEDN